MQGDKQAAGIRDGQMAKNLVWLAQTAYPDRKLIVWAASAHLARNIESVRPQSNFIPSNFYQGSVTMGHDAAKVIGDNLYSIMFSAAEGEVSMPWTPAEQVPAVSAGSIENMLIDAGHRNAFMDLHSTAIGADWLRNVQTARPFGFIEMSADWSRVCDAFFLTRKATRSTLASRAEQ
jgi:erythromycin esterase